MRAAMNYCLVFVLAKRNASCAQDCMTAMDGVKSGQINRQSFMTLIDVFLHDAVKCGVATSSVKL